MWFLDRIVEELASARDWFYDAYQEVRGWIFPFYYLSTPLWGLYVVFYYLVYYFDYFSEWLDDAAGKLGQILSYSNIYSYFKTYFDYAINAWSWVSRGVSNVTQIVNAWLNSPDNPIKSWIDEAKQYAASLVSTVSSVLLVLQSSWDDFKGKIPTLDGIISWWSSWTGHVLAAVNTWWIQRIPEVQGLIDTALWDFTPSLEGWQEFKDKLVELFTDPVDYIWSRFTDWFLGPEG